MKTVCCVMLANGREAMIRRAIRAFQAQTYEERYRALLIFDTCNRVSFHAPPDAGIMHVFRPVGVSLTIGALRNNANGRTNADIILHWDSDDWSHPNRITEQVALLEASGKEAVGYRDMLFWKTGHVGPKEILSGTYLQALPGEAWLYANRVPTYCLGTSLCYWREVWQRKPFEDTSAGEDTLWLRGVKSLGVLSFGGDISLPPDMVPPHFDGYDPRMIASIHGANTYAKIEPAAEEWKRVPGWDDRCREVMAL